MHLKNRNQIKSENGNALFLILIAVVLFAALSYAITQSNRGGGGAKSETASLMASQVMSYTSSIATGVTRMMIRGVDVYDLKFNTPREGAFTSDTNEQIFHPDGGGVSWAPTDMSLIASDTSGIDPYDDHGYWMFGTKGIIGIGTAAEEVISFIAPLKKDICEQINLRISGSKDIPAAAEGLSAIMNNGGNFTLPTAQHGQSMYCFVPSDAPTKYMFYHVLVEQ